MLGAMLGAGHSSCRLTAAKLPHEGDVSMHRHSGQPRSRASDQSARYKGQHAAHMHCRSKTRQPKAACLFAVRPGGARSLVHGAEFLVSAWLCAPKGNC